MQVLDTHFHETTMISLEFNISPWTVRGVLAVIRKQGKDGFQLLLAVQVVQVVPELRGFLEPRSRKYA